MKKRKLMNQSQSPLFREDLPYIVSANTIQNEPGYVFAHHKHAEHCEIMWVNGGVADVQIGNNTFYVNENNLLVFDQDMIHAEYSSVEEPLNCLVLAVSNIRLDNRNVNEIIGSLSSPVLMPGRYSYVINNLYNTIYWYCDQEEGDFTDIIQQLLNILISVIDSILKESKRSKKSMPSPSLAVQLRKYIDGKYAEPITLITLAEEFHFNPDYLCHIFTKEIGISPINYLVNRRIGESQFLLVSSDYSITEISKLVGYSNINHFSAVFKRKLGMSPSHFRNTVKISYL
jgi:AraC-like DNA-binding protein